MKFQFVVDKKGIAVFPGDTDLRFSEGDNVFFDTACRERGMESLYELVEALGMLKIDAPTQNWAHHKFAVEINVTNKEE